MHGLISRMQSLARDEGGSPRSSGLLSGVPGRQLRPSHGPGRWSARALLVLVVPASAAARSAQATRLELGKTISGELLGAVLPDGQLALTPTKLERSETGRIV